MTEGDKMLLKHAPCGIFAFRENGEITIANRYCLNLLEYQLDELTGKNISSLLTLSGKIFYQTHFYPLVKLHLHTEEIFLNLVSKSGKDVPVVLNAVVTNIESEPLIVCSFIEVLNRRKYEDEILQAKKNAEEALQKNKVLEEIRHELELKQKELDTQITLLTFQNTELLQLSNVITHDLQEPVRKLILFSHELPRNQLDAAKREVALSVINKSAQRIKTLLLILQEYLSLAATVDEKQVAVDLGELIEDEAAKLKAGFQQVEAQICISPLPIVFGNKEQLKLLVRHLIENAFVHGTVNSHLELDISGVIVKENLFNFLHDKYQYIDYLKITLTDKGPGFENKYNEYIFNFLKKLNPTVDTVGFGLAFCRKIVEIHKGTIKAESAVNKGATFTVMLPVNPSY
ncbi:MAG: PAS domain-containing sensor histidine kinase [Bacteroidota bacterium]|nr:PAS domain-containing sensor histidine kinase [Bacteroidota bacterium]